MPARIRREERHVRGAGERDIFSRAWLPDDPSASVLLIHGFAEHSGRYEEVATWLAARGIAVHAFDHQGHGRSSGRRCYVRRFSDLLDDTEQALARARDAHPGLPLFVVGHSMGGLVTASLAVERRPEVSGYVTSGAALAAPAAMSRSRRWLLRALRRVAPTLSLASGLDPEGLSTDPAVVRAYLEDPLVERRITTSLAAELFATMGRTSRRASEVDSPLLALHGEDDPICPPSGSREFAAATPRGRYLGFPGMRHEIFNEPGREAVFESMRKWLGESS
ncbi:MAG TPA: lysophospholipase [Myxococcota bacterium]|nr:lysophospholipase [Myxococcota bacterium]